MALTKLIGFAPDADPTTPGVITDCDNLIPTQNGFQNGYSLATVNLFPSITFNGTPRLFTLEYGNGRVMVACDGDKIVLRGNTTTTVQSLGTVNGDNHFSVAALGSSIVISGGPFSASAVYTNGGAVANVTGLSYAYILTSSNGFMLAFNIGGQPDEWRCCAHYDPTDWVISSTTECTGGSLVEVPGAIVAAKPLGNSVFVYKGNAIFRGDYVGAPEVWRFTLIPGTLGALSSRAVVSTGQLHYVACKDDIYAFDGEHAKSICTGSVREWYRRHIAVNAESENSISLVIDEMRGTLNVFITSSVYGKQTLVYHIETGKWGKTSAFNGYENIYSAINYATPDNGTSVDAVRTTPTVYSGGSFLQPSYDYASWASAVGNTFYAVFNEFGADDEVTRVTDFVISTIRHADASGSSESALTLTGYTKDTRGGTFTAVSSAIPFNKGKFNHRQSGKFHKYRIDGSSAADVEFSAWSVNAQSGGKR